jgi:EpsI family protein
VRALLPRFAAAVALLLVMLVLTRQYDRAEAVPLRQALSDFPMVLADRWAGRELGIPQEIREVLKADDLLMREYRHDGQPVWLFIAYYHSQRTGATYHSPLNCLPGGGWTIVSRDAMPVPIEGRPLAVNRVFIQKGLDKQLVLYWYQDRGRIITNEYWAKGYLVWDAMTRNRTDGALVRISLPVTGSDQQALAAGEEFLRTSFPLMNDYLPL